MPSSPLLLPPSLPPSHPISPWIKKPHCFPSPAALSANFLALPVCPPPLPLIPPICPLSSPRQPQSTERLQPWHRPPRGLAGLGLGSTWRPRTPAGASRLSRPTRVAPPPGSDLRPEPEVAPAPGGRGSACPRRCSRRLRGEAGSPGEGRWNPGTPALRTAESLHLSSFGRVQIGRLVQQTFAPCCRTSFHKSIRRTPSRQVKAFEPRGDLCPFPLLSRALRALGGVSGLSTEDVLGGRWPPPLHPPPRLLALPSVPSQHPQIRWGMPYQVCPPKHPLLSAREPDAVYATSPESQCTVLFKVI